MKIKYSKIIKILIVIEKKILFMNTGYIIIKDLIESILSVSILF